jgi:HEPN domain-containing protein
MDNHYAAFHVHQATEKVVKALVSGLQDDG